MEEKKDDDATKMRWPSQRVRAIFSITFLFLCINYSLYTGSVVGIFGALALAISLRFVFECPFCKDDSLINKHGLTCFPGSHCQRCGRAY